ncbi:chitinase domain-containing protein 1 isoform X2 [Teleopsis dalmanni]|uniref:chitinase domain-containing protein 1 isoform X2 n=1 Tax=Teleopsis dalmanni TaxID=139649 RepID=UPI0018CD62F6|nr:chitinase domain-containing protein 1 isoform X2 [Teleopsis dalmanni]
MQAFIVLKFIILFVVTFAECTISPGDRIKKNRKELKVLTGPQSDNVFDRNLIEEEPSSKDILVHNAAYYKDVSTRNFNNTVLGYVTPWNSHGYDIAKVFGKKFDIISPVWFQIIKKGDLYELAGKHDIDSSWVRDVRRKKKSGNSSIKFFPRLLFDKFTERDISLLLSLEKERRIVNELIANTCKEHDFDGIVLELWSQLAGRVDDQFIYKIVLDMAKYLKTKNLNLILVIPPFREKLPNLFQEKHLDQLYQDVYAFSLMTYDYSSVQRPGANSPLPWIRAAIEKIAPNSCRDVNYKRHKILLGLNMYGNDFTPDGGGPIVGNQYLNLLKYLKKRLSYDENAVENFFEVRTPSGRHYVFYPTLHSINERIKLAQELGVGISIWELGQGLDYFYDLL